MNSPLTLAAALQAGQPLFGNQWLALLASLGGIALLMAAVAGLGRWLAATHPAPVPKAHATKSIETGPALGGDIPPEVIPVIIASIATCLGPQFHVSAIQRITPSTPSIEALMQQWSYEGRRQIYSSHKVR